MVSSPITSQQIDGETVETVTDFISLGSKITADDDCSHEIKRCLLLGRKAVANLDSIIKKQRHDFTDKGPSSQSYGFSSSHVYGCESWTIKKAECWRIDAFEPWCWRRLLRVPWMARRSNQSILKEISPEYSLEGLMLKLKLQYFGHLMQITDSLEKTLMLKDWRQEEKGRTEDEVIGWHHRLHGHEFEQALGVGEGQGSLMCCSPWGHKESDSTEWLNWTERISYVTLRVI